MVLAGSPFHKGILFLFQLAWDCRFRLPLLITVGFMVLDVRMQLEINIDVERNGVEEEYEEDSEDDSVHDYITSTDSEGEDFTTTSDSDLDSRQIVNQQ